ncbi:MAG: hypothetical protein ACKOXB_04525 [Flavobacteriales bacterium]
MTWKEELIKYENSRDWESAIELMKDVISIDSSSSEAYISVIYLLHNLLLEEQYTGTDREEISILLKQYFNDSRKRFSENSEYLFFIGKILYIAEWYFGVDDDLKPIKERQAFKMQKKACEIEPNNILFEWGYRFSLGEKLSEKLAEIILKDDSIVTWLKVRGFHGQYILESLKTCATRFHK